MEFAGKTAVVTGASRGLGRAIALELAAKGANIAVLYAGNEAAANDTVREIAALGAKGKAWRCNVADFNATAVVSEEILREFGGVDILVNNAGIVRDALMVSMTEQEFDDVIDTNLKGVFNMVKHLYRHFVRRRAGRIINIGSVSGLCGNAGQANYSAAKAGLVGLTKSVARELATRGVTCNLIAPGFIESDMTSSLPENMRESAQAAIPMKRFGKPQEVAQLAAFLAGEGAAYITGTVIRVDGGMCM